MSLVTKQWEFLRALAKLIQFADRMGYELTGGELYRTKEQARLYAAQGIGIINSAHCNRLAVDLNLFIDGQFCKDPATHRQLGTFWKTLHPDACWGGDFKGRDGNHYSFEHRGVL